MKFTVWTTVMVPTNISLKIEAKSEDEAKKKAMQREGNNAKKSESFWSSKLWLTGEAWPHYSDAEHPIGEIKVRALEKKK